MKNSGVPSKPVALKLYGERNTGTNYIETLIAKNLEVHIFPGRVPSLHVPTMLTRRVRHLLSRGDRWHESTRDRYFRSHFDDTLGWKHMCPSVAHIGPERLAHVRFVMVLKNPYAWLLSLFRNPYHVGGRDADFRVFLQRRLPVMEMRENIGHTALTPVEVWNRKGHGYLALEMAATHALILKYEDFLHSEQAMITAISERLGIARTASAADVPHGVKRADRDKSHASYVDYYLQEAWRADLTPEAIEQINALLDPALTRAFGYDRLAADQGCGPDQPHS